MIKRIVKMEFEPENVSTFVNIFNTNEGFKKITLHDIAKQISQQNKEKIVEIDKKVI